MDQTINSNIQTRSRSMEQARLRARQLGPVNTALFDQWESRIGRDLAENTPVAQLTRLFHAFRTESGSVALDQALAVRGDHRPGLRSRLASAVTWARILRLECLSPLQVIPGGLALLRFLSVATWATVLALVFIVVSSLAGEITALLVAK